MSPKRPAGRGRSARAGLVAVVLVLLSIWSLLLAAPPASAYTPHPVIAINGNQDFTPANGVTGGSGTPSDPYVIEGWEIVSFTADNIRIENTDAHFVIKSVFVHSNSSFFRGNSGIVLVNVTNGGIRDSQVSENNAGISIARSSHIDVSQNSVTSNGGYPLTWRGGDGIRVASSTDVRIVGNNVSGNGATFASDSAGIEIASSDGVHVASNEVDDNDEGVAVVSSSAVTLEANRVSRSRDRGFVLESSTDVTLAGNLLTSDGVTIDGHSLAHFTSHTIGTDNLVNGKPLRYYRDCSDMDIDGIDTGQLLVAGCRDVRVSNLQVSDTDVAVLMAFVDGAVIRDSDLGGTGYGTYVVRHDGVYLYRSTGVTVSNTRLWGNGEGIAVDNSSGVEARGNAFWNNGVAMSVFWSSAITVANNTVDTGWAVQWGGGIHTFRSEDVTISGNNISRSGENIYVQDSDRVKIRCNDLADAKGEGIRLWVSTRVTIVGNTVSNSSIGIRVFAGNTGIQVHHNNVLDSAHVQAQDGEGAKNAWDDGYPSGGNHWSDYPGSDLYSGPGQDEPGSDGIGDTPYVIDLDSRDRYPLMSTASCPPISVSKGDEGGRSLVQGPADLVLSPVTLSNRGLPSVAESDVRNGAVSLGPSEPPSTQVSEPAVVLALAASSSGSAFPPSISRKP